MNPYKRMKNSTNFMDLNDDCLLYLLNFMKLEELLMLRGICIRLDNLLYQYRKRFDYFSIRDLPGAYEALQFLGPVIKTIYLYPRTFQNAVPEIFDWITEFCVNLESLDLAGVDVIPKQKFITLVRRVTSLTMRGVYFDDSLDDCFKDTSIEELKLVALRDLTEQFFIHISNLRALRICCCRTMPCDSYIQVLKKNLNLKKLEIKVSDGWYSPNEIKDSDKLVEYIANNLHEIEELSIDLTASNRSRIGNLSNLKKLEIELNELDEFDELDSWSWNQISHDINKLIENLSKSNTIEILFINGYEHHIDMDLLSKLTNLKKLSLDCTRRLTDAEITKLQSLVNLEALKIVCHDEDLVYGSAILNLIKSLQKLKAVDLCPAKVNVEFFEQLVQFLSQNESRENLKISVESNEYKAVYELLKNNTRVIHD